MIMMGGEEGHKTPKISTHQKSISHNGDLSFISASVAEMLNGYRGTPICFFRHCGKSELIYFKDGNKCVVQK